MSSDYFYLSSSCSGHGVRVPIDPTAGSPFTFYCVCDPGFSGEADYFDLRVNIPNVTSTGIRTSLDCTVNDVVAKVLWALLLATAVARLLLIFLALRRKYDDFITMGTRLKGNSRMSKFRYLPFQVLGMDAFGMLWMIYLASAKISNLSESVLGTSGIVTFAHVAAFASISLAWSLYEARTTFTLMNLKTLNEILDSRVAKWQLGTTVIAMISYLIVAVVSMIAVALPKDNGPVLSGEIWIVITRSIAMTVLGFAGYVAFNNVRKGAREISNQVRIVSADDLTLNGARITKLMAYLEDRFKTMRSKLIILLVIFWTLLIPYVYPYQYIVLSLALIINNIGANLALDFLRKKDMVEDESKDMTTSQKSSRKLVQNTLPESTS